MDISKLVIIEWIDHTGNAGWIDDPSKENPVQCKTVGWLVAETKDAYKVVDTISDEEGIAGLSVIIKSCVSKISELEIDKKGKGTSKKSR
tara:strand:+ start:202 stop:471 length:270 start_codon:yes stop_codon:yes gene_type:complete